MKNPSFNDDEIKSGKFLSIISYINILSIVSLLVSNNKYVLFHAKQGIRLTIVYSAILFILSIISKLIPILWNIIDILIGIVILLAMIFSLIGIIDVIKGKSNELFLINKLFQNNKK